MYKTENKLEIIKKGYVDSLCNYLGLETFVTDDMSDMDDITQAIFLILVDYYQRAIKDINACNNKYSAQDYYISYKNIMISILKEYFELYCNNNEIIYEKAKFNSYLINNRKIINIEDGVTCIYKTLRKITKRKKLVKSIFKQVKEAFK